VSIRRTIMVDDPPAKLLAALVTAAENLHHTVRRADPSAGVAIATSPVTREALSFGYIVTAHVQRAGSGTRLALDVTPRVGFWALKGAGDQADDLVEELRHVLKAPKARIRRPAQAGRPDRPFGYRPETGAAVWAAASVLVFGLLVGGRWWIAAAAGAIGGLLLVFPHPGRRWSLPVAIAGLLSLPFGLLGIALRRESLAHAYWEQATARG
jgi:hypothetical protein